MHAIRQDPELGRWHISSTRKANKAPVTDSVLGPRPDLRLRLKETEERSVKGLEKTLGDLYERYD